MIKNSKMGKREHKDTEEKNTDPVTKVPEKNRTQKYRQENITKAVHSSKDHSPITLKIKQEKTEKSATNLFKFFTKNEKYTNKKKNCSNNYNGSGNENKGHEEWEDTDIIIPKIKWQNALNNRECHSPKRKLQLDTDPNKFQKRNDFVTGEIASKSNTSDKKQQKNIDTPDNSNNIQPCDNNTKLQTETIPRKELETVYKFDDKKKTQ